MNQTNVSGFATPLISDAMHLRSIYSHRWNPLSLSFYRLRNSHSYRNFMFAIILVHTCSIAFVPPRDDIDFENVSPSFHLTSYKSQTFYLNLLNYIILSLYLFDLIIQLFYQHVYWRDVDWAKDYVKFSSKKKKKGGDVGRYRTSIAKESESIRITARSMRADRSFLTQLKLIYQNLTSYSYNSIFILNTLIVLAQFFSTIFSVPSQFGNETDTSIPNPNFSLPIYNNIGYLFTTFLILGYFVLMAYMTAIVFDGYYNVKIKISLQEYLTERSALAAAFLAISWDPVMGEFREALTLGDLLEANLKIHGTETGFHRTAELFNDLDLDQNGSLDENEFYSFCDAVCQRVEKDSIDTQNLIDASFNEDDNGMHRNPSSTESITDSGRLKKKSSIKIFRDSALRWYTIMKEDVIDAITPFIPDKGSHILFNHILELFRSGLIQVFFLLACIYIYLFAVMGMFVLGKDECIAASLLHKDLDEIPYYERFDTFQNSMLTMFRMATGSGWHEIMFLYWDCEAPWGGNNFVPAFFVTFHFTFCIVFYNVLGGLIFAHYKQMANTSFVDEGVNAKKKKRRKKGKKGKKNRKTLAKRNSTAIPEMRKSARFWREAMEQGAGDEDDGMRSRAGSMTSSPGIPKGTLGKAGSFSKDGMSKMEGIYEQHLLTQQLHKTAHKSFNYNPWSSKVLASMADRLLRPNAGMSWDVTIIDKKTDGEINNVNGSAKKDRRERSNSANSVGSVFRRIRASTSSTVSTAKTLPRLSKRSSTTNLNQKGDGPTVANRRRFWLKSMGVMSSTRQAQTKAGFKQKAVEGGSGQSVGIEMQDKSTPRDDDGGDGNGESHRIERNFSFESDRFGEEEEDDEDTSSSSEDESSEDERIERRKSSKGRKLRRSVGGNHDGDDVDMAFKDREMQLSDAEFQETFGMNKEAFKGLAAWKQKDLKKKYGYF
ncbi:hypothetical protein TL16_g06993 [Triparma laevis f. inornata]|uniref:Uncharacterized protein n=1 Tax=Triparma laevis f. inornata TaxID=1714386 RepID=A0A9W7APW0_9STRA|nr:hypothetical protein TL16_g06993 [Triparma laevis f. inornata]